MIIEIPSGIVTKRGRKLDDSGRELSWERASSRLREGEKLVVVTNYRVFPTYAFLAEDEKSYDAVAGESHCKGVYAVGAEILEHQRPFVPYDGP